MSYILDALKKSEQERGQGNVPSVQTMHTSSLNYSNKKTYWPYILIAAIVLNLIAIVFVYLQKDQASTDEAIDSIASNTVENSTDNIPARSGKNSFTKDTTQTTAALDKDKSSKTPSATSTAKTKTTQHNTNTGNSPATVNSQSTPKENDDVVAYYDLPDAIKQQLPTITVSAHIYSSNPLLRSIVINNNLLEEGEYILDGLILQEITADGAIILYEGIRFHYEVVSGWQ